GALAPRSARPGRPRPWAPDRATRSTRTAGPAAPPASAAWLPRRGTRQPRGPAPTRATGDRCARSAVLARLLLLEPEGATRRGDGIPGSGHRVRTGRREPAARHRRP